MRVGVDPQRLGGVGVERAGDETVHALRLLREDGDPHDGGGDHGDGHSHGGPAHCFTSGGVPA